ncbi:MAG: mono/diheme cytochrome c family protein, partial [Myxococcota bacterium]
MKKHTLVATAALGGLLAASTAQAFPWDIDMVDAVFLRAYEWEMMLPPEGAIPTAGPLADVRKPTLAIAQTTIYREACEPTCRANAASGTEWDRTTAAGTAHKNPLAPGGRASDEVLVTGEQMYNAYCTACHGKAGAGGAPVAERGYPAAPPNLSGEGNSSQIRSDGYIFLTIRNGGAIMPSYSYGMSDEEIWSVVAYIRTLP